MVVLLHHYLFLCEALTAVWLVEVNQEVTDLGLLLEADVATVSF
jgi:hypothetical protein